jgi:hypothetical protein
LRFQFEIERESDGRWIAEIPEVPGALAYGASMEEAGPRPMRSRSMRLQMTWRSPGRFPTLSVLSPYQRDRMAKREGTDCSSSAETQRVDRYFPEGLPHQAQPS